jgi:hypothetical protein
LRAFAPSAGICMAGRGARPEGRVSAPTVRYDAYSYPQDYEE